MSSHADTIRRRLMADPSSMYGHDDALEALDALLAENQRLETERDMLRRSLEGEMAENQRLRDALERLAAEPCEMAFVLEEIGRPEKDCREAYTNEQWCAPCIAREALAGDAE